MALYLNIIRKKSTYGLILLGLIFSLFFVYLAVLNTSAVNASGFQAGKIIDDGVFVSKDSMGPGDIQTFLNSKVPTCDTNGTQPSEFGGGTRAQYGASRGYPAPYICLKNYSENGKSSAQIIYDAAQEFQINPKVLIVLLQKEQGLVTDTWPFPVQYRSATGYGCPDTAPCDSQYYGLTNQIRWSARMFRAIMNASPTWYTPYILGSNNVRWSPNFVNDCENPGGSLVTDTNDCDGDGNRSETYCGYGVVNIQNRSTQALYNYTPYQPSPASLAAGWGTAPSCGAYGNRNFYLYFTEWFGSTQTTTPYAWSPVGSTAYIDNARAMPFTGQTINMQPGQTSYVRLTALNTGYQTWDQSIVHLGTTAPHDRSSAFTNTTWLSANRLKMGEASVPSGQVATFDFEIKAPTTTGIYYEKFSLVADGIAWLNDPGLGYIINVVKKQPVSNTGRTQLNAGEKLNVNENLLSSDSQSVLRLNASGDLGLISGFKTTWHSNTSGSMGSLSMQADGNLVLYRSSGQPVWNTETSGNPGAFLALQPDGNLVIYSATGTALWSSGTVSVPDHLSRVYYTLYNKVLYPGQSLLTPDEKYRMVLQPDGNLVIYSPTKAIWASGTSGKESAQLNMQPDGNLVIYDKAGTAIWNTRTSGNGPSTLSMQPDGNLVIYSANKATWDSGTRGKL